MSESQRMEHAAYIMRASVLVFARCINALARIEGMKALNAEREHRGESLAYSEEAFVNVATEEGIYHNAVVATLSV